MCGRRANQAGTAGRDSAYYDGLPFGRLAAPPARPCPYFPMLGCLGMRRVSWAPGRPSSCRARPAHLIGPSAGPLPRLATRASCAVVCARAGVAVVCARCTPRRRCRVRSLHAPASLLCALAARAGVAVVWARCTRRRQRKSGARGGCGAGGIANARARADRRSVSRRRLPGR